MSIDIKELQVAYDNRIIIDNATLQIPEGKVTMIIGENGCGKSTLLKSVARIIPYKKGEIFLHGKLMKAMTSKDIAKIMAVLPQSPVAPSGLRVKELVAYGRYPYQTAMRGMTNEDLEIIDWAMCKTGVYEWRDYLLEELSGGQRQRAWIALAIAQKTKVLVLDEPTTYLDMAHQLEILELLRQLNKENNTTIVIVIHELNLAAKFADHIIGMKKGKILFSGSAKETITVENLKELYNIKASLQMSEQETYPICTDYELVSEREK